MGLKSERISGYAKGYGFADGRKIFKVNHDWNAVKIDGVWQLVDVTWGSSESERTKSGLRSKMKIVDYWFLTDPKQFIFSHLPQDKKWQLTRPKIDLEEFNKLPFAGEIFFELGFDANEIFHSVRKDNLRQLVNTYRPSPSIKIIDAPFVKTLTKGREYKFKFESSHVKRIAIIEDKKWTYVQREGNIFSHTIDPKSIVIKICIASSKSPTDWETILVYNVSSK